MIADLLYRYYEVHGTNPRYELFPAPPARSFMIEGHEVAWMRYHGEMVADLSGQGREGQAYEGYGLECECDFTEGVGYKVDAKHGGVGIGNATQKCLPRAAARHLRTLELRAEYTDRFEGSTAGVWSSMHTHFDEVVLDLIEKVKANEFVGEDGGGARFYGGYLYLQTVADVLDISMGMAWDRLYGMIEAKKVGVDGAVILPYREPPPEKWEEHARLDDDGWTGVAYLPGHRAMAREWKLEVLKPDGNPAYSFVPGVPLTHDPVFGPDVDDVAHAQDKLRELIARARDVPSDPEPELAQ